MVTTTSVKRDCQEGSNRRCFTANRGAAARDPSRQITWTLAVGLDRGFGPDDLVGLRAGADLLRSIADTALPPRGLRSAKRVARRRRREASHNDVGRSCLRPARRSMISGEARGSRGETAVSVRRESRRRCTMMFLGILELCVLVFALRLAVHRIMVVTVRHVLRSGRDRRRRGR